MIGRRVAKIIKRFANYCANGPFIDREFSNRANAKGEARARPSENRFAKLTPSRFRRCLATTNPGLSPLTSARAIVKVAVFFLISMEVISNDKVNLKLFLA